MFNNYNNFYWMFSLEKIGWNYKILYIEIRDTRKKEYKFLIENSELEIQQYSLQKRT